jgi:soluble cytochrome b562
MRVGENLFRTLKAEYDNALAQVDLERTANAHLERQILAAQKTCGAEPAGQECSALQSQIDVLTTQLAKAVAAATQRETLLETFRQQQAVLVQSVKQDRSERRELERRIEELHRENKRDRVRFEGKLKGRDRRIAELEREVRDVGTGVEVERRGREMVVEKEEG